MSYESPELRCPYCSYEFLSIENPFLHCLYDIGMQETLPIHCDHCGSDFMAEGTCRLTYSTWGFANQDRKR